MLGIKKASTTLDNAKVALAPYVAKNSENILRFSKLAASLEKLFKRLHDIAKTPVVTSGVAKELVETELQKMANMMNSELDMYLMGIQSLMDGRFSPAFANPDKLQIAYSELLDGARSNNLFPISEDAATVFQSQTSVLGTADGDMVCIIHVPLYSGSLMKLYKYVSAPFLLHDGVVATIKNSREFLAIDSTGTLGKEMSLAEVMNCKVVNGIHHCGSEGVIQKNLDDLCLYNLYHQRVDEIERLCKVEISKIKSHAIQINGNQFRILVAEPTQLTWSCNDDKARVETIEGVFLLTLNETCPKANTPDHLFTRNNHILASQNLIALPLVQKASEWIKGINKKFKGINLSHALEHLEEDSRSPVTIEIFKKYLENIKWIKFYKYLGYVQLMLTAIAIMMITWKSLMTFRKATMWCRLNVLDKRLNQKSRRTHNRKSNRILMYKSARNSSANAPNLTETELKMLS